MDGEGGAGAAQVGPPGKVPHKGALPSNADERLLDQKQPSPRSGPAVGAPPQPINTKSHCPVGQRLTGETEIIDSLGVRKMSVYPPGRHIGSLLLVTLRANIYPSQCSSHAWYNTSRMPPLSLYNTLV